MQALFGGAIAMGLSTLALIFYRYWIRTRDRLLACFAIAFLILALERLCLVALGNEHVPLIYTLRLCAFLTLLVGIVEKNRST